MLKCAVVGLGNIFGAHVGSFPVLKDKVEVIAYSDLVPEKTEKGKAAFPNAKCYASGEELIENEKADFIMLLTPTYTHAKLAVMAMEHGMNVFCEKPACLNAEEAALMLDAQKRTGKHVQIGQVIRFWDTYLWLRDAVNSGKYGKFLSADLHRLGCVRELPAWFHDPELCGSVALDLHLHDVDFVRYMMGRNPDEIKVTPKYTDENNMVIGLYTTFMYGETVINVTAGWDNPSASPFCAGFRANFENALVIFDEPSKIKLYEEGKGLKLIDLSEGGSDGIDTGINVGSTNAYLDELIYFTDCLANGKTPDIVTLEDAAESVKLVRRELEIIGGCYRK